MKRVRHALVAALIASGAALAAGLDCRSLGEGGPAARLVAQVPPPAPVGEPASPSPADAVISGTVTDRSTGRPLARARVELVARDGQQARAELTDSAGRYEFAGVTPGEYTVRVWKTGYVTQAFGPTGWLGDGPPLAVAPGTRLEHVDVRLVPGGVVTGRVRDADGRPLAWAVVEAQRPQVVDGQVILQTIAAAECDDRGEYRLMALPPGRYYVSAYDAILEGPELDPQDRRFGPTYYPGVVFLSDAERVTLELGESAGQIDFQVQFVPPARVAGRLVTPDGRRLIRGAAIISPYARGQIPLGPSTGALIQPNGAFEFANVPPGRYIIRARGEVDPEGPTLFGSFVTPVEGVDIENVVMTLKRGAVLSGVVTFESAAGQPLPEYARIFVTAMDADTGATGGATEGFVGSDGRFRLSSMGGDRLIRLDNLPAPWLLKQVLHRGRNITDVPFRVEAGEEFPDIHIVVADRAATLTGVVRDASGEPVADRAVVVLPLDQSWWRPRGRHVRLAYPDVDGRYSITGLPAATYFAAAVEPLDPADLLDSRVLERIAARAARVTLEDGRAAVLDLQVPAPEPPVAGRRAARLDVVSRAPRSGVSVRTVSRTNTGLRSRGGGCLS